MHPLAKEASISSAETAAANRWLALWPAALLLVLSAWILPLHAASITVNTATDDFGAVSSNCSLREAIQSANNNADFGGCNSSGIYNPAITDVINLPQLGAGGFFTLNQIGLDDSNANGDLDITGNVRINGFNTTNSVIRGLVSNPDNERHRLIHVLSGTVTLNDLTLRDGLEGGASAGGGLRTEPGTTTVLNRVTVAFNSAGGNAGGILNRGTMTINASLISQNRTTNAADGGGGIFNSPTAVLTANDSRVLNNVVDGGERNNSGGGIYNAGILTLDNCVVDGNLADGRQIPGSNPFARGGGVYSNRDLTAIQTTISNNEVRASNNSYGGGIRIDGVFDLDRVVITGNRAEDGAGGFDGGLGSGGEIRDSVISNNSANRGGGLILSSGRVLRSTIANNRALDGGNGGGIVLERGPEIINSTIVGNSAENDGGGIFRDSGDSQIVKIRNCSIVGNVSDSDDDASGSGGLHAALGFVELGHNVIAGNTNGAGLASNCAGTLLSVGYNLIESSCLLQPQVGDQLVVSAQLAAAANNGGPIAGSSLGITAGMLTRSPLPGSPLIDSGDPTGCKDPDNVLLSTDQIGRSRAIDGDLNGAAICDRGAVEFRNPLDTIFASGFE